MNLIDTHAHYTDERFDADREELVSSLPASGVSAIVNCASCESEWAGVSALAHRHPHVFSALGVHGLEAETATEGYLKRLEEAVKNDPKCVAIGEIGLDYYYSRDLKELQKRLFDEQLDLAVKLDLPVIVHDRDAHRDVFDAIMARKGKLRGVLHCYSGSAELVLEYAPSGFYFGFGGSLTFKNNEKGIRAAAAVPLDRLLLETDCPYLAPVPHRGKRNDSTLMKHTLEKLAEVRGMTFEELATITTENAIRLFGLPGVRP
ncbi:MAG: TatD family hydrolase [Christensenellales bacterium]|jgi:TatD DNase family protein